MEKEYSKHETFVKNKNIPLKKIICVQEKINQKGKTFILAFKKKILWKDMFSFLKQLYEDNLLGNSFEDYIKLVETEKNEIFFYMSIPFLTPQEVINYLDNY